jgi:hypothetical protein
MNASELEDRIQEFSDRTIEAFHFLESQYGYCRNELERSGFESLRDAEVFIQYFSKKVAVEVTWAIGASSIAVGLYELKKRKIPEKVSFYGDYGYARAINLDSLVRMLTDGKVTSPLPEYLIDISFAEMCRRAEKATEMIRKDIGSILKTLADRLKEYGADILKGDTSIFPQVQKHHRKYWEYE